MVRRVLKKLRFFQFTATCEINKTKFYLFNRIKKLENKTTGLSLKGKSIAIPHETEYKNTSLLAAITTTSILHYSINEANTNGIIFYDFIKETILKLNKQKGYIFLMDNVPLITRENKVFSINAPK